jgi:hypothetical protein
MQPKLWVMLPLHKLMLTKLYSTLLLLRLPPMLPFPAQL